jgi:hypothetical protein
MAGRVERAFAERVQRVTHVTLSLLIDVTRAREGISRTS